MLGDELLGKTAEPVKFSGKVVPRLRWPINMGKRRYTRSAAVEEFYDSIWFPPPSRLSLYSRSTAPKIRANSLRSVRARNNSLFIDHQIMFAFSRHARRSHASRNDKFIIISREILWAVISQKTSVPMKL